MLVVIPHAFAGRQGNVPASELDENFDALADAFNLTPIVLAVSSALTPAANRAAIQAAHDALPASGGVLWQTVYGVHIDAVINITKPVLYLGPGTTEVSTPGVFALYLDAVAQTGFHVTGKGPFAMQDMSIRGTTDTTSILLDGPTGALKGAESCRIDNVVFLDGAYQLDVKAAIFWGVSRCLFWNPTTAGVRVRNLLDADQGDSFITSSAFNGVAGAFGVVYNSGGGLKVTACKFLGFDAAIAVDPTTSATDPATISDLIIAECSIESFLTTGIFLTRTSGALVPVNLHIVNCQIAALAAGGLIAIDCTPAGAAGAAYQLLVCIGNLIGNTPTAYRLRKLDGAFIEGNTFAMPGGVLFDVDATVTNLTIGENLYYDFATLMTGTPGANCLLQGGKFTVAQLPPVAAGSQCFAADALGPGDGGYTGYGMICAGGGNGAPAFFQNGQWKC